MLKSSFILQLSKHWSQSSWLFKLRLFLGLIIGVLVLILFYFKIVPSGQITYQRTWPRSHYSGQGFISSFKPDNRLDLSQKSEPKIIANPVYFSVFTPRRFNTALVTVTYQNHLSSSTPIIELGVLKGQLASSYDLQPLQNNILDYWRSKWSSLKTAPPLLILQATPSYSSAKKFLSDLRLGNLKNCSKGLLSCLAVYNYTVQNNYSLKLPTSRQVLSITQPLRGAHQFYLYLDRPDWYLDFEFTYLRQDSKPDPITVNIWFKNKLVMTKTIPDHGSVEKDPRHLQVTDLNFSGRHQPTGVYKVEVKINRDVVIKRIKSSTDKLVVIHQIWPVSSSHPLTLFTDAQHLRVQTSNPRSLGKIVFGKQKFNLQQTYQPVDYFTSQKNPIIQLSKDDIILTDAGVFSFSAASLFNPEFTKINRYFQDRPNIKYLIANYQSPIQRGQLKIAQAKFNLLGANRSQGRYTFVISIPGLEQHLGTDNYLQIKKITISLSGKTLWQKIWP